MSKKLRIVSRVFRPWDIESVSEIETDQQRDWKRRGFFDARTGDVMEAARFLFVKTLRDAGFDLARSWKLADDEIVGWLVLHAGLLPGAICDNSGTEILKSNPSFVKKAAMELTGRRAVAAGPLFAWSISLKPGLFPNYESAHAELLRTADASEVLHTLDLRSLPSLLVERSGIIGYIETADE